MFHDRIIVQRNVSIPMRDGVNLRADIYRPSNVDTPLPILLMRLPYGRAIASTVVYKHPSWYADRGYIVVIQEVRGTGNSQGEFYPFKNEYSDGFDTVQWCIAEIPHNNGKLGMYGFSYQGVTQLQTAVMQPQGLVTICPCMASADLYNGFLYWGGALCWEFVLTWGLQLMQIRAQHQKLEPLASNLLKLQAEVKNWLHYLPINELPILQDEPLADFFCDWLSHCHSSDAYWQKLNPLTYFHNYDLPALHIAGWADIFIEGSVNTYFQARKYTKQPQYLIIPPYQHFPWSSKVGDLDFSEYAMRDIDQLQIDWFDFWLKGIDNGIIQQKPMQLFLMMENHWLEMTDFPNESNLVLYLAEHGKLLHQSNSNFKLDSVLPDTFVYDPRNPTPSTAYSFCDQQAITQRWDNLLYKSDVVTDITRVVGIPKLQMRARTTARQIDWVIKLLDIFPDGQQILVTMGVLRTNTTPDRLQEYVICLRPTAYSFFSGHQIAVAIACSAFPMISRGDISQRASDLTVETQQIYPSSQLILPIWQADGHLYASLSNAASCAKAD